MIHHNESIIGAFLCGFGAVAVKLFWIIFNEIIQQPGRQQHEKMEMFGLRLYSHRRRTPGKMPCLRGRS
jgi:hypothetical protein